MMRCYLILCVGVLALVLLTGCDPVLVGSSWLTELKTAILGAPSVPGGVTPSPMPSPSDPVPLDFSTPAVSDPKANAEILREMMEVVFMKEPKDRSEFGNWTDTLNQGASIEGVYNGLTHSTDYRKLETANLGASPDALRVFSEELAYLESELPVLSEFDATSASPLPVLGNPDSVSEDPNAPSNVGSAASVPAPRGKPEIPVLVEKFSKVFVGASIFTLKRVICDDALRVVSSKNEYREKLAFWYSKWVIRIAQRNVDFGIALRNKPDEAFHYKWALQSTDDRIKWEVLNRLHRVLNEANRHKQ